MHPSFIEIVVRKGGEISTLLSIRKKTQTFGKNVRHKRATSRTPVLHTVTQKKYDENPFWDTYQSKIYILMPCLAFFSNIRSNLEFGYNFAGLFKKV